MSSDTVSEKEDGKENEKDIPSVPAQEMLVTAGSKMRRDLLLCPSLQNGLKLDKEPSRQDLKVPGSRVFLLDGILTDAECAFLIEQTERMGYSSLSSEFNPEYRNNDRVLTLTPALADVLWSRISPLLTRHDSIRIRPIGFGNAGTWRPVRLNECIKFGRYSKGSHFHKHIDGPWVPHLDESSIYTLVIYLNSNFTGGTTRFIPEADDQVDEKKNGTKKDKKNNRKKNKKKDQKDDKDDKDEKNQIRVTPKTGRALIFNHDTLHEGESVISGTKYILRTELMFVRIDKDNQVNDKDEKYLQDPNYLKLKAVYAKSIKAYKDGKPEEFVDTYLQAITLQRNNQKSIDKDHTQFYLDLTKSGLPFEVWLCVFSFLSADDCGRLLLVSKFFYDMVQDGPLWRRFYIKRWKEEPAAQPNSTGNKKKTANEKKSKDGNVTSEDWLGKYRYRLMFEASDRVLGIVLDCGFQHIKGAFIDDAVVVADKHYLLSADKTSTSSSISSPSKKRNQPSHSKFYIPRKEIMKNIHLVKERSVAAIAPAEDTYHYRTPERYTIGDPALYEKGCKRLIDGSGNLKYDSRYQIIAMFYNKFRMNCGQPVTFIEPEAGWPAARRQIMLNTINQALRPPHISFINYADAVLATYNVQSGIVVSLGHAKGSVTIVLGSFKYTTSFVLGCSIVDGMKIFDWLDPEEAFNSVKLEKSNGNGQANIAVLQSDGGEKNDEKEKKSISTELLPIVTDGIQSATPPTFIPKTFPSANSPLESTRKANPLRKPKTSFIKRTLGTFTSSTQSDKINKGKVVSSMLESLSVVDGHKAGARAGRYLVRAISDVRKQEDSTQVDELMQNIIVTGGLMEQSASEIRFEIKKALDESDNKLKWNIVNRPADVPGTCEYDAVIGGWLITSNEKTRLIQNNAEDAECDLRGMTHYRYMKSKLRAFNP